MWNALFLFFFFFFILFVFFWFLGMKNDLWEFLSKGHNDPQNLGLSENSEGDFVNTCVVFRNPLPVCAWVQMVQPVRNFRHSAHLQWVVFSIQIVCLDICQHAYIFAFSPFWLTCQPEQNCSGLRPCCTVHKVISGCQLGTKRRRRRVALTGAIQDFFYSLLTVPQTVSST